MTKWTLFILSLLATSFAFLRESQGASSGYSPFGDIHWKYPVASVSALPSTGNLVGDARTELTAFGIYIWNGSSWVAASGSGAVTSVTATAPIVSSGGTTPNITCNVASGSQAGCLSSTDWSTFNSKQAAISGNSCTSGQYADSISSAGSISCAQVAYSQLSGAPTIYYQTVQSNGSSETQRANINFTTNFSLSDSSANNRSTVDLASTISSNTTGNAGTSTALASTPTQCTGGQVSTGIAANGNANCTSASSGTVTSVGLADSTNTFNITNSPVTSSGTLTLSSFKSQTANEFLAAPNGSSGAPSFRLIVPADLPSTYGNLTINQTNGSVTVTSGNTLTYFNINVRSADTYTINSGANMVSGNVTVNGTLTCSGTCVSLF